MQRVFRTLITGYESLGQFDRQESPSSAMRTTIRWKKTLPWPPTWFKVAPTRRASACRSWCVS